MGPAASTGKSSPNLPRGRYRRLSKDYEKRTETSAAMVQVSAIHHMLRRLKPKPCPDKFHYKRPRKKAA